MLPYYQSKLPELSLMQTAWASQLNPVLKNALMSGQFLKDIALINGATKINHLLSRTQQGWFITDINGAATIYRSAPLNDQTLTLTSNAAVTVSIYVF